MLLPLGKFSGNFQGKNFNHFFFDGKFVGADFFFFFMMANFVRKNWRQGQDFSFLLLQIV